MIELSISNWHNIAIPILGLILVLLSVLLHFQFFKRILYVSISAVLGIVLLIFGVYDSIQTHNKITENMEQITEVRTPRLMSQKLSACYLQG